MPMALQGMYVFSLNEVKSGHTHNLLGLDDQPSSECFQSDLTFLSMKLLA